MSNNEALFITGLVSGVVVGIIVLGTIILGFGLVPNANDLQKQCEKDLPRNLKCEMVYVKPNDL